MRGGESIGSRRTEEAQEGEVVVKSGYLGVDQVGESGREGRFDLLE